jgi:diaminopimelate decarboxylase
MTASALLSRYGSPLWLADLERFQSNLRSFERAWRREWPEVRVAYSYKTNRLLAFLHAAEQAGAGAEVVCEAEYMLAAAVVEADPARIVVDGPAKPDSLLARAGAGAALVLVDSIAELDRAAAHGVTRLGLRVALDSFTGAPTRFGIPPAEIPAAARAAESLGLAVSALSTHLVSTDFDLRSGRPVVSWPREADEYVRAASVMASLAGSVGRSVQTIDLGGGFPRAAQVDGHARAVAAALRDGGFAGALLLEPGRALVADAMRLAFTVVVVKSLRDGRRCLICDAGTNLLPGALVDPPTIEAPDNAGQRSPALVTGPLCLNTDVLHAAAPLPAVAPGDALVAVDVGAYQQAASTQFGEPRPAVVIRERGAWRLHTPAEGLVDLLAGPRLEPDVTPSRRGAP